MPSARVISCALFVVVALGKDATDQQKNVDYLRGEENAWSCELQAKINQQCSSQGDSGDGATRRSLAPRQSSKPDASELPGHPASSCTCNNIYFNIWSACYLTNDNTYALPSLREWKDACIEAGTPYENNRRVWDDSGLEGLGVPPWAQISVPVHSDTFDVMQAVVVAAPGRWKMVHVLAPIFSCLGTLLLVGIVFFTVSKNRSKASWFKRLRSLFPSRSAQYEAPRPDWVIDYSDDTLIARQRGRVEASKSSLSVNGGDLPDHGDRKGGHQGHADKVKDTPRKVLKKLKQSNTSTTTLESNRPPPLDLTDAFSDTQRISPPLASRWSDSDSLRSAPPRIQQARRIPGTATLHSLVGNVRIPNPFGSRPSPPQEPLTTSHLQYYDGYRPQLASPKNYETGFRGSTSNAKRSIRHPGQRQNLPQLTEERQSLISDEDRRSNSVFLISNAPGQDFAEGGSQGDRSDTMNSIPVNVESPTASSRESWRTKTRSLEPQPPRIPPPPRYPPPAPPSRSQSNATYPLADIPEDSDKPTSSSASSSRNASESQSPPSVGYIPTPFRGYAYAPDRYPTPDASPSALSEHRPLPSIDSYFEVGEHGGQKMTSPRQEVQQLSRQQTPRQQPVELQPSTSTSPPGRQIGPFIPNGYHQTIRQLPRLPGSPRPTRGRTLSASSSTSSDGGTRHWRRPSDEEPSTGFYFSPSSPSIHLRTLSNDNLHRR